MLGLVAYGASDDSDSDEEPSQQPSTAAKQAPTATQIVPSETPKASAAPQQSPAAPQKRENGEDKLFSALPTPRSTFSIPDNTFKLLNKKQPVKIVLPSLSEMEGEEEVKERKKQAPSKKGSGLFALLPAPKNQTGGLVPKAVSRPSKPPPKKPIRNPFKKAAPLSSTNSKSDDEDEDFKPESFFFSSVEVKPEEIQPVDIPSEVAKSRLSHTPDTPSVSSEASYGVNQVGPSAEAYGPQLSFESPNQNDIDEEAIEKLCGVGAKKRKGGPEEIIDINVDSMVGDAYMWLAKDLTTEQEHTSFKKAKNLSTVERRKHQITYLASQAKEKEMELRNQWANSRVTRKQTQSKYGF